jgi:hypothetical protein
VAGATIIIGSLIALRQNNLKRRLAYSTIVHLSYIVLGAALVAPFGVVGSVMHMVNHGLAKITLFFCAGAIYATTHLENVSDLRGLGRRMPWTFTAFTIGSLGLVGIPGLSGFVSKFFLSRGAIEGGDMLALAIMLGASLFTATYLLPIVQIAFFPGAVAEGEPERHADVREARPALVFPPLITSLLVDRVRLVPLPDRGAVRARLHGRRAGVRGDPMKAMKDRVTDRARGRASDHGAARGGGAIPHYHPVFPWHYVPGYAAVIGLVGCIVVVQISKWLGRVFLQRPEGR